MAAVQFLHLVEQGLLNSCHKLNNSGNYRNVWRKRRKMEENKLHYHMKVRVFRKEGAFGPGVAELMRHVEETGSLSEACRCMGMAYSKGWRIMKHAEEDLGFPLMEGSRGGSRGGRTMLTEKGKDFLYRYEMFMAELNRSAGESFMRWFEA